MVSRGELTASRILTRGQLKVSSHDQNHPYRCHNNQVCLGSYVSRFILKEPEQPLTFSLSVPLANILAAKTWTILLINICYGNHSNLWVLISLFYLFFGVSQRGVVRTILKVFGITKVDQSSELPNLRANTQLCGFKENGSHWNIVLLWKLFSWIAFRRLEIVFMD